MQDFEKLGAFYLGRVYDREKGPTSELVLYDARDLTTHAVCVGMTGSGKTGLCIALLEEAALDGIPSIAIDPKGDLGNLLLAFSDLGPSDFQPWVDPDEAAREGVTVEQRAAQVAERWRTGLAEWGQDPGRISRFRSAVQTAIYTPGSSAGLPVSVLRSLAAPAPAVAADPDALRERVSTAASGLLALLGVEADPIRSREHILVATILDRAWRQGRGLALPDLIREIQSPAFDQVGVMDVESFFPSKDRLSLATTLNNLLASPAFSVWMEGDPLDVASLLHTKEGRPRISVISIAHLNDAERMFFVTMLLNEVVAWMRGQQGTSSLRAILYMDEIFGYFPPTANPPSKAPMLTLLKQARAYGLGIVLATQNPVDLDYKGLSNAGTWLLGRLQTVRDKEKVLDGLEGVTTTAGRESRAGRDRRWMDETLSALPQRVFLMNNVHEDAPVLFQTRWTMSYLRGPLTKQQISRLMAPAKEGGAAAAPSQVTQPAPAAGGGAAEEVGGTGRASAAVPTGPLAARPLLPPEAEESFLAPSSPLARGDKLLYRAAVLGVARVHYISSKAGVDQWEEIRVLAPLGEDGAALWDQADSVQGSALDLGKAPAPEAGFFSLPPPASRPGTIQGWRASLADHLYQSRPLALWHNAELKQVSRPGEAEGDFRLRLAQLCRERRDAAVESLRKKYAPKLETAQEQLRRAEERVAREKSQFQQQTVQTAISVGATVLGALFGRKRVSAGTIGRATTAMRGAGRTAREKQDIERAEESVEAVRARLADLQAQFDRESAAVQGAISPAGIALEDVSVSPRKSDISVQKAALVWTPWREGGQRGVTRGF